MWDTYSKKHTLSYLRYLQYGLHTLQNPETVKRSGDVMVNFSELSFYLKGDQNDRDSFPPDSLEF